jgi:hypothetical protein
MRHLYDRVRARFAPLGGVDLELPPREPVCETPQVRLMLILDTNMLSEIMRPEPDRKIADWIVRQPSDEMFTAAGCQAEILSGLAIMPARRSTDLEEAARAMFADDFSGIM